MPVFVRYGSVTLDHCRIHTTYPGDLINVKMADFALTENCDLMGYEGFDSDGIDYDGVKRGIIRNNRIYGIYGFNSDAIDLGEGAKDILVENNVIFNVKDKGVSVGQASTTLIRRNVIANCALGVAVKDFDSHAQIEHNTLYANQVGVACYEKILGHGGARADVVNSIIANSTRRRTPLMDFQALRSPIVSATPMFFQDSTIRKLSRCFRTISTCRPHLPRSTTAIHSCRAIRMVLSLISVPIPTMHRS